MKGTEERIVTKVTGNVAPRVVPFCYVGWRRLRVALSIIIKVFISKYLIGGSITTEGILEFEKRINKEFDQLIFQQQT